MPLADTSAAEPLVPGVAYACRKQIAIASTPSLDEQVDLAVERVEVERHEHRPVACIRSGTSRRR